MRAIFVRTCTPYFLILFRKCSVTFHWNYFKSQTSLFSALAPGTEEHRLNKRKTNLTLTGDVQKVIRALDMYTVYLSYAGMITDGWHLRKYLRTEGFIKSLWGCLTIPISDQNGQNLSVVSVWNEWNTVPYRGREQHVPAPSTTSVVIKWQKAARGRW